MDHEKPEESLNPEDFKEYELLDVEEKNEMEEDFQFLASEPMQVNRSGGYVLPNL